jgi:hypothetical protein
VTFEDGDTSGYQLGSAGEYVADFEGNESSLEASLPGGRTGKGAKLHIKGDANPWSGTTFINTTANATQDGTLFSADHHYVNVDVYSLVAGTMMVKMEGGGCDKEIPLEHPGSGWETLKFEDLTVTGCTKASFFPLFFEDGRQNGVVYIDNAVFPGAATPDVVIPVTSPSTLLDFEGVNVFESFGGASNETATAPAGASTGKAAKLTSAGECWAGTTLAVKPTNETMLSAGKTSVTANVYAPAAGAMVRLKLEYSEDTNIAVQADATATVAGWNRITWDLSAYDNTKVYNKINVFPGFSCDAAANNPRGVYYIDDLAFNGASTPKLTQSVLLDSGANVAKVGDADRNLTASVKVGDNTVTPNVVFSSTTPSICSVEGTVLKFLAGGTCGVSALQPATASASEGVASSTIDVTELPMPTITVRSIQTGSRLVSPDGFFIYPSSDSQSSLKLSFKTPNVCAKGPLGTNHVLNLKTGSCRLEISQVANTEFRSAVKVVSYSVSKAGTIAVVDAGNLGTPVLMSSNGASKAVLSEVLSWKKSTGTLKVVSRGVWVGPIKATASFKVGSKSHSCSVSYGVTNGVAGAKANSLKSFAAPAFCSSNKASDKSALAALKALGSTVSVKIVVVRELRNPAAYAKQGQKVTRTVLLKIGK